jgi:hypothetical protein
MKALMFVVIMALCVGCAMSNEARIGLSLGVIGMGIASIVTGDVIGGAMLLGSEALALSIDDRQAIKSMTTSDAPVWPTVNTEINR